MPHDDNNAEDRGFDQELVDDGEGGFPDQLGALRATVEDLAARRPSAAANRLDPSGLGSEPETDSQRFAREFRGIDPDEQRGLVLTDFDLEQEKDPDASFDDIVKNLQAQGRLTNRPTENTPVVSGDPGENRLSAVAEPEGVSPAPGSGRGPGSGVADRVERLGGLRPSILTRSEDAGAKAEAAINKRQFQKEDQVGRLREIQRQETLLQSQRKALRTTPSRITEAQRFLRSNVSGFGGVDDLRLKRKTGARLTITERAKIEKFEEFSRLVGQLNRVDEGLNSLKLARDGVNRERRAFNRLPVLIDPSEASGRIIEEEVSRLEGIQAKQGLQRTKENEASLRRRAGDLQKLAQIEAGGDGTELADRIAAAREAAGGDRKRKGFGIGRFRIGGDAQAGAAADEAPRPESVVNRLSAADERKQILEQLAGRTPLSAEAARFVEQGFNDPRLAHIHPEDRRALLEQSAQTRAGRN